MGCLPAHGRVDCTICHESGSPHFDVSTTEREGWRITFNPLAWGHTNPEVLVLGFSKGPTQAGALRSASHDAIAYKGSRLKVGKILAHIGLIPAAPNEELRGHVDTLIADPTGRFHFSSLVRCTVEQFDRNKERWRGSGGGMLDKFMTSSFGSVVSENCARQFLRELPSRTKLIVMFGLGSRLNYVRAARQLISRVRPGDWHEVNEVAYTDGKVTVVHVEHFASQGALIPNWLGENDHLRSNYGRQAKEAVQLALPPNKISKGG